MRYWGQGSSHPKGTPVLLPFSVFLSLFLTSFPVLHPLLSFTFLLPFFSRLSFSGCSSFFFWYSCFFSFWFAYLHPSLFDSSNLFSSSFLLPVAPILPTLLHPFILLLQLSLLVCFVAPFVVLSFLVNSFLFYLWCFCFFYFIAPPSSSLRVYSLFITALCSKTIPVIFFSF